ncbi:hypothetical protein GGI1_03396 [Acidithiobacillus sp. GGI-221]|nr:hypothetical protein GGI1_03396 [Acidithiobacillus sp. GGI-221]
MNFARISHMIPKGETCIAKDGTKCPFFASLGMDDEDNNVSCYLRGEQNIVYNDEFRKDWNCLDATN